jgi:hypothetical protein
VKRLVAIALYTFLLFCAVVAILLWAGRKPLRPYRGSAAHLMSNVGITLPALSGGITPDWGHGERFHFGDGSEVVYMPEWEGCVEPDLYSVGLTMFPCVYVTLPVGKERVHCSDRYGCEQVAHRRGEQRYHSLDLWPTHLIAIAWPQVDIIYLDNLGKRYHLEKLSTGEDMLVRVK